MVVWRRTVLAGGVLAALLLAAVFASAQADARRHLPTTSVGVSAREYRLAAYRTSVPRGTVRFNLANYGEDGHDLVVRTRGGRELGRTGEVRAGKRTTLQVRLAPGTYRLICDLADHEARGMRTTLRVTR
jgi:plastocyanin